MRYVAGTTDDQKRRILDELRALYDNEYVVPGSDLKGLLRLFLQVRGVRA